MNLKNLIQKKKEAKANGGIGFIYCNLQLAMLTIDEDGNYFDTDRYGGLTDDDIRDYDIILLKQSAKTGFRLPYKAQLSFTEEENRDFIGELKVKPVKTQSATNTVSKILDKDEIPEYRQVINYSDGFMYATDSHSAVRVEFDYDDLKEGKQFTKDGDEFLCNYPRVDQVIEATLDYGLTFKDKLLPLISYLRGIQKFAKNLDFPYFLVSIDGQTFDINVLLKALYPMVEYGGKEISIYMKKDGNLRAESDGVVSLVCPNISIDYPIINL